MQLQPVYQSLGELCFALYLSGPIAPSDKPLASAASISSCFIIKGFPLIISLWSVISIA
uniref:MUS81 n=1 Tax=Arundo donax TaxID=35708 RepID=A0A0A9FBE5_ARUDO